jgi:hypothetical protein
LARMKAAAESPALARSSTAPSASTLRADAAEQMLRDLKLASPGASTLRAEILECEISELKAKLAAKSSKKSIQKYCHRYNAGLPCDKSKLFRGKHMYNLTL